MSWVPFCCLIFSFIANLSHGAEILVISPVPSYSHFTIPFKLAKELAARGHKITCISAYPQNNKIENYKDVPVVENIDLLEKQVRELMNRNSMNLWQDLTSLFKMTASITNGTILHKNVQELINSKPKFDVILIEHFFNEALIGFGQIFDAPVVLVSTHGPGAMNNFLFSNPAPLSYVPNDGSLSKHMSFWQRSKNFFMTHLFNLIHQFYHLSLQNEVLKNLIPKADLDDILRQEPTLMFTNSHPSFSNPNPVVPAIIEVGGFHVTPKPIPSDFQKFLDESPEGVVLFSMGSSLKSKDLKPHVKNIILKVFSKLKEKILWKFESDLPEAPNNVKIFSWLPQVDILGHPNIKAFITHGGRLSTIEAVYHGVPLIGIPVFGDQFGNIATAVNDGYALQLNLDEITEESLTKALDEILNNDKYRQNVQQRSRLLQDQPIKPMDNAVFWVEHVIRNKGAPHLRSSGLDLTWYQREMLDVLASIALGILILVLAIKHVVKQICKKFCCKKEPVTKNKKQQ